MAGLALAAEPRGSQGDVDRGDAEFVGEAVDERGFAAKGFVEGDELIDAAVEPVELLVGGAAVAVDFGEMAERGPADLDQLADLENNTLASDESLEQLRADIRSLEEELQRLQASAIEETGTNARAFVGDGDRQYLTGMFLGGNRVLILVDTSASMLDETLVNIIRTRNMSEDARRGAEKWQRAVRTVEWISSQLPVASQYQIYGFSNEYKSALAGTEGTWLEVADRDELNRSIEGVKSFLPEQGTNLANVFLAAAQLSPPPDNIYLITDGLPTLSNDQSSETLITPAKRLELFEEAVEYLPQRTPVNVILLPLEGDPSATAAYWQLAQITKGSFLSPARDWP